MDKRSIPEQILSILEDAGEPLTISEISKALDGQFTIEYVRGTMNHNIKKGKIKIIEREKTIKEKLFII